MLQSVRYRRYYLNTAKTNFRDYICKETVSLKKYFYVLRPILACRWILEKGTPPPILFDNLAKAHLEDGIKPDVERLLELKRNSPEIGEGRGIDRINDYLDRSIAEIEAAVASLPRKEPRGCDELNEVFADNIL